MRIGLVGPLAECVAGHFFASDPSRLAGYLESISRVMSVPFIRGGLNGNETGFSRSESHSTLLLFVWTQASVESPGRNITISRFCRIPHAEQMRSSISRD